MSNDPQAVTIDISDISEQEPSTAAVRTSQSYAHDKTQILNRLRRIEGQVRGVQRMVEDEQYCLDVLTQLSAIIAGAKATGLLLLEDHIRGCVVGADPSNHEAVLTELNDAIARFTRSVG